MVNLRTIFLILAVLALGLWTTSCGGNANLGDALSAAPESAPAANAEVAVEGPGAIPGIPQDRAPSADPPDDPEMRVVLGKDYLAMHNGTVDGTALILDAPDGEDGEYAWGVYRFSYLHGLRPLTLVIETIQPEFGDEYWVGVANYTKGVWDWFGPTALFEYEIDLSGSDDRYVTTLGNFYFVLLVEPGNTIKHIKSTLICGPGEGFDPPGAPSGLVATDGDFSDKVRLTWQPGEDANGYEVWRTDSLDGGDPDEDSWQLLDYTLYTLYDDFEVVVDEVYYYKVRAYNYGGYSGFSNVDSGYAHEPSPPPTNGLVWGKVGPTAKRLRHFPVQRAALGHVPGDGIPLVFGYVSAVLPGHDQRRGADEMG